MASGSNEDRALFKKLKFNYAVFDEGHMLKNMSSMRYQSLMKIRVRNTIIMSYSQILSLDKVLGKAIKLERDRNDA